MARQQQVATGLNRWDETYRRLVDAGADTLSDDDLELLAQAAFWVGRPLDAIPPRRRLYARQLGSGDAAAAALTAWRLYADHFDLNQTASANGWLQRARRHADDLPGTRERGYVSIGCAEWASYLGDPATALQHADEAIGAGEANGDPDLTAMAQCMKARILIRSGTTAPGVELIDEAMLSAVDGQLSPFTTGWVYCILLTTCHELGDIRRAAEWTELALRWCEHLQEGGSFPGMCRLHRCEVTSLQGDWSLAETEALRAADELSGFGDYLVAEGQYLAGDIRRMKGDAAGAREAFRCAHGLGRDPQPGLALLQAAEGDVGAAQAALRVALMRNPATTMHRARLLAACVEVELRAGDVRSAQRAAAELTELATTSTVPLANALALVSRGAVLLATDDARSALAVLEEACATWNELSCPYESAQARTLLGLAARRAGDEGAAQREWEAAKRAFVGLGAVPAAKHCADLMAQSVTRPCGLTEREVEVLRLVAHGKKNRDIAAELFISEHTVARHLSNAFRKMDVATRAGATAFAFEHSLA